MHSAINVAVVGLRFGAEFITIYQRHPNASMHAICQRRADSLNEIGDIFGIENRYTSYEALLADQTIDAVHLNTDVQDHAKQAILALEAGKHVACAVPMGISVEECRQVIEASERSGCIYMMMETAVFTREFLYLKALHEKGELGNIQYLRSTHQQDMDGWPSYWRGLPPMHYATHCVAPCLALPGCDAESVICAGSGRIREELIEYHNSPFAVESCHIRLAGSDISANVMRSLFDTSRQFRISFEVYATRKSFEWPLRQKDKPVIHTAGTSQDQMAETVDVPDYAHLLPAEIARFTRPGVYKELGLPHLEWQKGGGNGGSHPHAVHEFLSAIMEKREPFPSARQAANWTCVGILAHESAMNDGERKELPAFTRQTRV